MKIEKTSNRENLTVNSLVYGLSKVGKTHLISTAEAPFIISIEDSMLSLVDYDIPFVSLKDMRGVAEVMAWLSTSAEAKQYKTICIDSITELGELLLAGYKEKVKDARLAYGEMADEIFGIIRAVRALPFDFYVIAKAAKAQDITGATVFSADLPGAKSAVKLPYLFDETWALRSLMVEGKKDPELRLQCKPDGQWEAGDKSGKLEMWEKPDLKYVFDKIRTEGGKEKLELRAKVKELRDRLKDGLIEKQQAADEFDFLKEKSAEMGIPLSIDVITYMNNFLQ